MAQQHFPAMPTSLSARKINLVGSRIGVAQSDLSRMEQGEYKVGLDTLFKLLQVFDLKIGEFFGESETAGPEDRELVTEYRGLSDEARQEVRDFVRFKKMQEQARPDDSAEEKE